MNAVLAPVEWPPWSAWMRSGVWPFPVVSTLHVFGIALLFSGTAVLDLRPLGIARALPVAGLARLVLLAATTGLALALATGGLMFAANPREYAANPDLPWKICFVVLAGANGAVLHLTVWRSRERWVSERPCRLQRRPRG